MSEERVFSIEELLEAQPTLRPVGKVASALAKAQGDFPVVPKNKTNPHFRSSFAGLDDLMKAVSPALAANGLAITHLTGEDGDDGWVMRTRLYHESGEYLESALPIKGATPQAMGSEITYMRRYTLGCVLGVVSDDDDDGEAAEATVKKTTRARAASKAPAKKKPAAKRPDPRSRAGDGTEPANKSLKVLWPTVYAAGAAMGLEKEEATNWFRAKLEEWEHVGSTKDLDQKQANNVLMKLQEVIDSNTPPDDGPPPPEHE